MIVNAIYRLERGAMRRITLIGLLTFLLASTLALVFPIAAAQATSTVNACLSSQATVTRISSPVMFLDTSASPALLGFYEGYAVTNTSANSLQDLWVTSQDFSGPEISLAPQESGFYHVGSLAAGATSYVYFYLQAAAPTTTAETHDIVLFNGDPSAGGSSLCGSTQTTTATADIKASANKVTQVSTNLSSPVLGAQLVMTVTGNTGTIGAGDSDCSACFAATPAAYASWPASVFRLVDASFTLDYATPVTYNHTLLATNLPATSGGVDYTITYTFTIDGFSSSSSGVSPVTHIASGTQVKHTDTGSSTYTSLPPIPPTVNTLSAAASISPGSLGTSGGSANATVTLSNSGAENASLDDVAVTLPTSPATPSYQTGSATYNASSTPAPLQSGTVLTFDGPWAIPAGGTSTFTFSVAFPSVTGNYVVDIAGQVGGYSVGATATSAGPVAVDVGVGAPPAPVAAPQGYQVTADTTLSEAAPGLLAGATGTNPTVTAHTTPSQGTLGTVGTDGSFTYTPTTGYSGTDTFTYTITDNTGTSSTPATVTLNVNPSAGTASATTPAGTPVTITAPTPTGTGPFTYSPAATPAHGTLTASANTFTYTPTTGYSGTDTFTYTATGNGGTTSAPATVTITVALVQTSSGGATSFSASTSAGTATTVTPPAPAGQGPYSYAVTAAPTHGTVTVSGGILTYTPDPGYSGTDTFTYTATGSNGLTSASATIALTVLPVAAASQAATSAATPVTVTPAAPAGTGPFSYTVAGPPAHGTVTITGSTFTYTPAAGYSGTDTFTYTATGNDGITSAPATVTVTVSPPAGAPKLAVGVSGPTQISSGGTYTLVVSSAVAATGGPETSAPRMSVELPSGTTFVADPSAVGWSCTLSSADTQASCGYTGPLPIAAGTVLPMIDAQVRVASTGTGALVANVVLTDTAGMAVSAIGSTTIRVTPVGYWLDGTDGGVFSFGFAFHGSLPRIHLRPRQPVTGMTASSDNGGYWLVAGDGGVFAFGDAAFFGSLPLLRVCPSAPIVGIASTPDDRGYWLVGSDGRIYTFGDAHPYGSASTPGASSRIVGITRTPPGDGYWLAASNGSVYAFGGATLHGDEQLDSLVAPIVGISATPDGGGYWLVAGDGGVFSFGDAPFAGSMGHRHLAAPVIGMTPTPSGRGYWLVGADGGVFAFGDAPFLGSMGHRYLQGPGVGDAS